MSEICCQSNICRVVNSYPNLSRQKSVARNLCGEICHVVRHLSLYIQDRDFMASQTMSDICRPLKNFVVSDSFLRSSQRPQCPKAIEVRHSRHKFAAVVVFATLPASI
jgi:hypothetical protein